MDCVFQGGSQGAEPRSTDNTYARVNERVGDELGERRQCGIERKSHGKMQVGARVSSDQYKLY